MSLDKYLNKLRALEKKQEQYISPCSNAFILNIIRECCESNGTPTFFNEIKFEWNNRLTEKAGRAHYAKNLVELSIPLFNRAADDEVWENTIAHEACHLLSYRLYGRQGTGHGYYWKITMLKAGYEPKRCHSINREGLRRKTRFSSIVCDCGPKLVANRIFNRIIKGYSYKCVNCNTRVQPLVAAQGSR